jgi:hypothetical protein
VFAAAVCLFMTNVTERMNWVVDAPLEIKVDTLSAKEAGLEIDPPTTSAHLDSDGIEMR